jgi:two-component system cell cycle sensor histidine kinase/response regulator CckA
MSVSKAPPDSLGVPPPSEALRVWAERDPERGLVHLHPDGLIASWNLGAVRITGYAPEEMIGRAWTEVAPLSEEAAPTLQPLTRKDGTSVSVEISIAPLRRDGVLLGHGIVLRDTERKREEELERYRACIDHAADALFTHRDGVVIDVNQRACESLGYTRDELIGKHPSEFDPDVTPAQLDDMLVRLTAGETVAFDSRHRRKDGSVFPVEVRMRTFLSNGVRLAFCLVRDITERKRTEEKLRASEERFEFALRGANDGIWDWNLLTDDVVFSSRWKSMLGYADADLPDHVGTWRSLVHPDDLPAAAERVRQYLSNEIDKYEIEFRMAHKEGGYRNILARGYVVSDDRQRPVRFVGTHVDVTERKRAELALRKSEEMLRRAQAIAHVTSWSFDIATSMFSISDEGTQLMSGEYAHADVIRTVHPDDAARVDAAWRAAVGGAPFELEHRLFIDGEVKWVCVRATTDLDGEGRPVTIIGVTQDVTTRRALEEQILQRQKMEAIGQLAGGIAHDFNNIIAAVLTYAEVVAYELGDDHQLRPDVQEIAAAAQRAAALTGQLLTFSRQQPCHSRILALNPIVEGLDSMLRRIIGEDIEITTVLGPMLGSIEADRGQLEQLLLNLAVNGRDAMPTGGKLRIETSNVDLDATLALSVGVAPGSYVMLSVGDTGCGIDEATRPRIFEPFFTTKQVGKGTGLGLAIVFGIVKQAGGGIAVDSVPGRGARFNVYFPRVAASAPEAKAAPKAPEVPRGTETVLVVEDDAQVRAVLLRLLRGHGYAVLLAGNAREALEILGEPGASIHLVLTDLVMPEVDGRTMAAEIRQRYPRTNVLFMSGYTEHAAVKGAAFGPADRLIQKPFTRHDMLTAVRRAIDRE